MSDKPRPEADHLETQHELLPEAADRPHAGEDSIPTKAEQQQATDERQRRPRGRPKDDPEVRLMKQDQPSPLCSAHLHRPAPEGRQPPLEGPTLAQVHELMRIYGMDPVSLSASAQESK